MEVSYVFVVCCLNQQTTTLTLNIGKISQQEKYLAPAFKWVEDVLFFLLYFFSYNKIHTTYFKDFYNLNILN